MDQGQVRELDRVGNDKMDEAADSCRRRVVPEVIDARRKMSGGVLVLHRFVTANFSHSC